MEMHITVPKAGKEPFLIDTDKIPVDVYEYIFKKGLEAVMGRGLTKVKSKDLEGDELETEQKAGHKIVTETVKAIYDGKIRMASKAGGKLSGKVKTEAMRLAKIAIKAAIKDAGERIKDYEAKEITALAAQALAEDDSYIKEAEKNLADAESKVKKLRTILPKGKPQAAPKSPPKRAKGEIVAAAKHKKGEAATAH
jgi:hypothetical protein